MRSSGSSKQQRVLLALSVTLGLVLLAWVATSGAGFQWQPHRQDLRPGVETTERAGEQPSGGCAPDQHRVAGSSGEARCVGDTERFVPSLGVFEVVLQALAALSLVALVIWLFRHAARGIARRREERRRPVVHDVAANPDVVSALTADTDQQIRTLRTGEPRNAIVACWARLEATVEVAGVEVRPDETSSELTLRVLSGHLARQESLQALAALYREARFSRHPITDDMREQAVSALRDLLEDLARPAEWRSAAGSRTSNPTALRHSGEAT